MRIQEMARTECFDVLARARFGRLGCAYDNQPYVVPIYFACDETHLYGVATFGKKIEWMRANPLVCVEVEEVASHNQWETVVIFGRYEEMPDRPEWQCQRAHAHELLRKRPMWWQPAYVASTHRGVPHSLIPVFYRIRIDEITGHRALPDDQGRAPESSSSTSRSRHAHGWLSQLIHRAWTKSDRRLA